MRINHASIMLSCAIIMFFLFACGSNEGEPSSTTVSQNPLLGESRSNTITENSENPLAGTWISGGYSLTFKSDNTYRRDSNHEGIPAIRGSFTMSGNVIILTDTDGLYSCIDSSTKHVVSGSYTYAMTGTALTFSLFHDPCSDRAAVMSLTYTKE